jgi:hypothetical protein
MIRFNKTYLLLVPVLGNIFIERRLGHPMSPPITERGIISNLPLLVFETKVSIHGEDEGIDPPIIINDKPGLTNINIT